MQSKSPQPFADPYRWKHTNVILVKHYIWAVQAVAWIGLLRTVVVSIAEHL